jgi:small subunit ribosomal protein S3
MSVVKRIIRDSIEKVKVDELLAEEYEQAGYGGITLTKTPLGAQINLFAMRPGRVIGKRGRAIKMASERLENELGLSNPQITVVEVEVPELNPKIMAARVANALERGVHYRRAIFWSLNRTMEAGAIGCEILIKGPLRSNRGRFEKVSEGYVPKSGEPALRYVKTATVHVKMKKGTFGVNVSIVPPNAKFPDKINLDGLPVIEYPEEQQELPEGVEPEPMATEPEKAETSEVNVTTPEPEAVSEAEVVDAQLDQAPIEPEADPFTVQATQEAEPPTQEEPIEITKIPDEDKTEEPSKPEEDEPDNEKTNEGAAEANTERQTSPNEIAKDDNTIEETEE